MLLLFNAASSPGITIVDGCIHIGALTTPALGLSLTTPALALSLQTPTVTLAMVEC